MASLHRSALLLTAMWSILAAADGSTLTIGAILASQERVDQFHEAVSRLNASAPRGYEYQGVALIAQRNPMTTSLHICDELLPQKVNL